MRAESTPDCPRPAGLPPGPSIREEPLHIGWFDPPLSTSIEGIVARLYRLHGPAPKLNLVTLRLGLAGCPDMTPAEREKLLKELEIELLRDRLLRWLVERVLTHGQLLAGIVSKSEAAPAAANRPLANTPEVAR